ncbi:MAG: glycosyltransferase, partial [Pedobacter sp.]
MKSVSIIIVTYNAGQDLQACFDSIRKQASSAIEVIVVDGGSKDNTVDIIRANNDIIATWISEKDDGIYDAMNKAIKLTKQDWIYFMGADDTLLPEFSTMLEALRDPYTIYYG